MTKKNAALQHIETKWPDGLPCPLCGQQDWFTTPEGPHSIEGLPMAMSLDDGPDGWAPPVAVWLVICGGCGFVAPLLDDIISGEDLTTQAECSTNK